MRSEMRAIAIMRNEGDIVPTWVGHALALFDAVFVMDHGSTDGTREFLDCVASRNPRLHVLCGLEPGYYQAEFTNLLARVATASSSDCWLFALDADEFLPFETRESFTDFMDARREAEAIRLPWLNCIPYDLTSSRMFDHLEPIFVPPFRSRYSKLAVRGELIAEHGALFAQGNHAVLLPERSEPPREFEGCGLFHVPIRSLPHFTMKIQQGVGAYRQVVEAERRALGQGFHWFDMLARVQESGLTADLVRGFIRDYGLREGTDPPHLSIEDLLEAGYKCTHLRLASSSLLPRSVRGRDVKETIASPIDQVEVRREVQPAPSGEVLLGDFRAAGEMVLHRLSAEITRFEALPPRMEPASSEQFGLREVRQFLAPAFSHLETPVPSEWTGHVRFLLALLSFLKPRRFVGLGVDLGGGFFPACQVSKADGNCTECIAVDRWRNARDESADTAKSFEQFRKTLRQHYAGCGRYLREEPEAASRHFAPGSVDVLLIDERASYEELSRVLQAWRPKLSSEGTVVLPNTVPRHSSSAARKLWQDIRRAGPSLEFLHCHGLGVAFIGAQHDRPAGRLMRASQDREMAALFQTVFCGIGHTADVRQPWPGISDQE